MPSANNIAFTAPINPPGVTPVIKREQMWAGLLLKARSAETFIPDAIESTAVISETTDPSTENTVIVREVVFRGSPQKVKETVTAYADARVDFEQPSGTYIGNIISDGADGELYLTYVFELKHPGVSEEEMRALYAKERAMSGKAVQGTIDVVRELLKEGKL
ncbi:hypothetical protein UA08_06664 [Talaromyces atroroseus]|uniref:DUF1857-domain-containing protein n=1 Tax=Talaromyces atroroseus TaxID=1441469 RepID=A0A225AQS0_TALAT|nr:hypothetical protein UA08_06664 [Talaromyces atroroseus]OKL57959.1 hypothetical protein UA08_06664 [Talaromyces atroroseus]